MYRKRIIPVLTLREGNLVKTLQFGKHKYIGDPINAVKIFNKKEADELMIVDLDATKKNNIQFDLLERIATEAFMPLGYCGGVKTIDDFRKLFYIGFEKVAVDTTALTNTTIITQATKKFGAQSVVGVIDVKKDFLGKYKVYNYLEKKTIKKTPDVYAQELEEAGCGEIIINDVENDGMMKGYDLKLIKKISESVNIPVIALGGAGSIEDLKKAEEAGASAVGAGSLFVFYGPHKAVLINYPSDNIIGEEK